MGNSTAGGLPQCGDDCHTDGRAFDADEAEQTISQVFCALVDVEPAATPSRRRAAELIVDAVDFTCQSPIARRPVGGASVVLNVYHLSDNWLPMNAVSDQILGIGGAFHAGVEVHGAEWSFGTDGVERCAEPRMHPVHVYHTSVPMGYTTYSPEHVVAIIEMMMMDWRGEDYDLLAKNCCSFANALCQQLIGEDIPNWVDRLPTMVSTVADLDNYVGAGVRRLACGLRPDPLDTMSEPSTTSCTPDTSPRTSMHTPKPFRSPFFF